ncbi:sugar phosphate isomerase/epimerase [Desulfovibrio mangrovi]|uniref:sugar phosphate isomerase/epimerase family protein n=1 Tax=Desulfovibrio mangrovi TaxID=2976983 RepID=UPI0022450917|nr:sugar phosphate isomerase/epimerase family protein [Desulfovibrio mangrovi]UZP67067.1 sugar phosphate isomerase/epimerase [Desulfovibrio mangrovi]
MPFFVNLPLSYAHHTPAYVEMFIARGVHPELGMDTFAVQALPKSWHRDMAARFRDAGLSCSIHLPFFDLSPGSMNNAVLEATRATLIRAAELASIYAPAHMVGHPHFNKGEHAPHMARWIKRSVQTWEQVLDITTHDDNHPPLFLENTFERAPHAIVTLLEHLPAERCGFCLDIGHWHSFAQGFRNQDLAAWVDAAGARLGHLHLHDNDGSDDQHTGLGSGTIPLDILFDSLRRNAVRPSVTLEPHDEGAFETSLAFMQARTDLPEILKL